jgi:hypothetical protein
MVALSKNFKYSIATPPYTVDSFTKNILVNPPIDSAIGLAGWNVKWKIYHANYCIDYFSIRQDSLEMAQNADVIYVGDDDFKFDIDASKVINECCLYMIQNPDCGAILLAANFGGLGEITGDQITIVNNGHLNTNRGIIVRNRPKLMENRFHALGAMEDSIISFTCLMDGYYIARRCNVPIRHIVERHTLREHHDNPNYDLNWLKHYGVWSKVSKLLGGWEDQNIWPPGIWTHYRQAAMVFGRIPRYTPEGEIDYGKDKS